MGNVAEYRNQVAIIGAAVVPPVRRAAVPVAGMAVRASQLAIEDAGLDPSDIDGVACGTQLPSYTFSGPTQAGRDFVDADFLINHMRLQASWRMDDDSFPPAFMFAVQAIASGMATHVLVNRTLHNPKGRYNSFGRSQASGPTQWTVPYGFVAPTSGIAMPYKEYQQRYGARRENMGKLVVQQRKNVQRIPDAYWHGTELTLDDYMNCRMISEPMCLLDNDIPVDGSGSFVLTTAERARDLPHKPVYITDWAQVRNDRVPPDGTFGPLDDFYDRGFDLAERLWSSSGWKPRDVAVVQPYDGFTPLVYFWLEALGFCPVGEAWRVLEETDLDPQGTFPLLSGGGNTGWGRLHGLPHVLECYLQLAGRAGARQIAGATTALSTYATPARNLGQAILYTNDPAA